MFDVDFKIAGKTDTAFRLASGYKNYKRGITVHSTKQQIMTNNGHMNPVNQTCYMEGTILKHGFVSKADLIAFGIKNLSPLVKTLRDVGAPLASIVIDGETFWFYANETEAVLKLVVDAKAVRPAPPLYPSKKREIKTRKKGKVLNK
jgi:hypothetical protein